MFPLDGLLPHAPQLHNAAAAWVHPRGQLRELHRREQKHRHPRFCSRLADVVDEIAIRQFGGALASAGGRPRPGLDNDLLEMGEEVLWRRRA